MKLKDVKRDNCTMYRINGDNSNIVIFTEEGDAYDLQENYCDGELDETDNLEEVEILVVAT